MGVRMKLMCVFALAVTDAALTWSILPSFRQRRRSLSSLDTQIGTYLCIEKSHSIFLQHHRECAEIDEAETSELVHLTIACLCKSFRLMTNHQHITQHSSGLLDGWRVTVLQHWRLQCEWRRKRQRWKEARNAVAQIAEENRRAMSTARLAATSTRRVRDVAGRTHAAQLGLMNADSRWREHLSRLGDAVKNGEMVTQKLCSWQHLWYKTSATVVQLTEIARFGRENERRTSARQDIHAVLGLFVHGVVVGLCALPRYRISKICVMLFIMDIALMCDDDVMGVASWVTRFISIVVCLLRILRTRSELRSVVISGVVQKIRCTTCRRRVGCRPRRKNSRCGQAVFLNRCLRKNPANLQHKAVTGNCCVYR